MKTSSGACVLGLANKATPEAQAIQVRESEINQEGKARKLWDIEEGKGI
ncbi:hypothetical protein ACEOOQ_29855 [Pseudomonas aeruginosa]